MLYSFLNTFYKSPELKSQFILYMNILSIIYYIYLLKVYIIKYNIYLYIYCVCNSQTKRDYGFERGGSMREVGGRKRIGGCHCILIKMKSNNLV